MYRALEAADILEQKYGLTAGVFDCRSINPLDYDPLVESVRKTGKVLLHQMPVRSSVAGYRFELEPIGLRRLGRSSGGSGFIGLPLRGG